MTPTRAMVLAAGRGERMRPLTDALPKPLVAVAGRALIDRVLDRLAEAGVREVVVNAHHLADRLAAHLASRHDVAITLSRESSLLDTGGGVAKPLGRLGPDPFYVVNGDVLWLDGRRPALARLAAAWREDEMDALLLLARSVTAFGYGGQGDFRLDPLGRVARRGEGLVVPYVFAGIQILHPRLFADAPAGAFSLNRLYDRAAAAGRLHGIVHDGEWFHVGAPDALAEAEAELSFGPGSRAQRLF